MKKKGLPLLLFLSVFFMACPYSSKIPIDEPNKKIEKELLGKWIKSSNFTKEKPDFYSVEKLNKFKYKIIENTYSSTDSTYSKKLYTGHISTIDNTKFLNIQKEGTGNYKLYKIDIGDNEFTLFEITDNIDESFNTASELKDFIKKNMNLSFFFNNKEKKYLKEEK